MIIFVLQQGMVGFNCVSKQSTVTALESLQMPRNYSAEVWNMTPTSSTERKIVSWQSRALSARAGGEASSQYSQEAVIFRGGGRHSKFLQTLGSLHNARRLCFL